MLVELTKVKLVDSIPRGLRSGHKWRACAKSFLRPPSSLVLNSVNNPCLSGGKELTPLPPPEEKSSSPSPLATLGPLWGANGEGGDAVEKDLPVAEGDDLRGMQLSPVVGSPPGPPGDLEDDEGLKHLQQEAEKLVASLQDSSLEEEQFTAAMHAQGLRHSAAATALPLSHGAARKWFYKDPQGEIQGAHGEWRACRRGC